MLQRNPLMPEEKKAEDIVKEIVDGKPNNRGRPPHFRYERKHIKGSLDLTRMRVEHPVSFVDCEFDHPIILDQSSFPALTMRKCRCLQGAEIPLELHAKHIEIRSGDLDLREFKGSVDLSGGHLRDDLHLENAELSRKQRSLPLGEQDDHDTTGMSLFADGMTVGGNIYFGAGFHAQGRVSLCGAKVEGVVDLKKSKLDNRQPMAGKEIAFDGDGITVGGEVRADGMVANGQVRLIDAKIGRALELQNAHVCLQSPGPEEEAILLDRSKIGASVFGHKDFECIGTFRAVACTVNGSIFLDGASIKYIGSEKDQCSLILDASTVGGKIQLGKQDILESRASACQYCSAHTPMENQKRAFTSTGKVSLVGIRVNQEIRIDVTGITNSARVAVDLMSAKTPILRLYGGGELEDGERKGLIDLTQAEVVVLLDEQSTHLSHDYVLKGMRYSAIRTVGIKNRIDWVRRGSSLSRSSSLKNSNPGRIVTYKEDDYTPQPYEQLAAALRAVGDEKLSEEVLYYKHADMKKDNKSHKIGSRLIKPWDLLQRVVLGYGYKPGRALLTLFVLWAVGVACFWFRPPIRLRAASAMSTPDNLSGLLSIPSPDMSVVEHFTYPLDLLIPLVGIGQKNLWYPISEWSQIVATLLTISGWLVGATVVAGITRVVKRN